MSGRPTELRPLDAFKLYDTAKESTRVEISAELESVRWQRKHGIYLQWASRSMGFVIAMTGVVVAGIVMAHGQPLAGIGLAAAANLGNAATAFVKRHS